MIDLFDNPDLIADRKRNLWVRLPIIRDLDLLPSNYQEKGCIVAELGFYHLVLYPSAWFDMGMRKYFGRKVDVTTSV